MLPIINFDELLSCPQVFVACSGGLDSMVLMDVLQKMKIRVRVLHCNFGLRAAESDGDEVFVRDYCEMNLIPLEVKRFDVSTMKKNENQSIQQFARDLRYAWFEEVISNHEDALLCTAHHYDDDIEQVLLRLLSSGRILDLGGIAHARDYIRRPLLEVKKADLLQYANENDILWREDSSNAEAKYTRNKIRMELIPLLKEIDPRYESALARLANEVKKMRVEAEVLIGEFFQNQKSQTEFLMPVEYWTNQLSVFKELFLETWKNSSNGVEMIDKLLHAEPGKRIDFDDFYVMHEMSAFWFGQHSLDEVTRREIKLPDCKTLNVNELDLLGIEQIHQINATDEICVDVLLPGAEIHLPNEKIRKVKKVFNDQHWSHSSRKKAAGLYINGKLVQLLDLASRREVFFRISDNETVSHIAF